ncbi:MAG: hypothetical protein JW854_05520 [Actinobacteria bacterium]|nr:hypothetical protein [Actinomycetota bacterium]
MLIIEATSDYEFGFLLGRKFGEAYRRIARLVRPLTCDKVRIRKEFLQTHYPQAGERLYGLARATGIELETLLAARPGNPFPTPGCTNFAAVPPATRDDRVYLSWNLDLPPWFRYTMGRFPFYVRKIKGCKPYLCLDHSFMGLPLMYGIGVMNSDGLCCVYNAVGMTDGGDGLTFFELNNMMMEKHADVKGAVGVMETNPRCVLPGHSASILMNANLLLADVKGDAALIEYSHNHLEVTPAADHEGLLASTNHHQFIDRKKTGGVAPADQPLIAGSYVRLSRMWELLRMWHGRIDPFIVQSITSDHSSDYSALREHGIEREWYEERIEDSTICAHPWNLGQHLRKGDIEGALTESMISTTLYGILLDPRRCTMWFHRGNPCRNLYHPYWLGEILEMDNAAEARNKLDYDPDREMYYKEKDSRDRIFTRPLSDSPKAIKTRGRLMTFMAHLDSYFERRLNR